MAEQEESSLIGYDPLAWMQEPAEIADRQSSSALPDEPEQFQLPDEEVGVDSNDEQVPDTDVDETVVAWPENGGAIVLDAVQNIQNVAQLHKILLDALENSDKIEIDASATTVIDTATLQLLLVLKQTAIRLQKEIVIDFPSDKFIEAAKLLGLAEILDVDRASAGLF